MHDRIRLLAVAAALAVAVTGCGTSHHSSIPPAARLEHAPGGRATRIVVSASGAQRIGLRTRRAGRAAGPTVAIPYSAVIYDPSGRTYAFVAVAPLTFTEVRVKVDRIDGSTAYLREGPHAGSQVVSTGAAELYGVQTGVLGQT
jgi:hypothetical protein